MNLKLISTILLISFASVNCFADDDVIKLEKDQKAPWTGVLFSQSKASELVTVTKERDNYKLLTESLERSIVLYKQNDELQNSKVSMLMEQNDYLSKSLKSSRDFSNIERIVWFFGGVLATGAALYGLSKIRP